LNKSLDLLSFSSYDSVDKNSIDVAKESVVPFFAAYMETYVAESLALRVQKLEDMKGAAGIALYRDILDVFVYDAADKIRKAVVDALYSFAAAEEAGDLVKVMEALTSVNGVNVKDARRRVADKLIEDNCYKF